jgi:hypothetical protein
MLVLLGKGIFDLEGKVVNALTGEPATVRGVVIEALLATFNDEAHLSGEEKLKRWELASKIKNTADPVELTLDELTLIKKLTGKAYGPLVVGQTWKILEGEA